MPFSKFTIDCFSNSDFATHTITDMGNIHKHAYYEFCYVVQGSVRHITPKCIKYYTNNTLLILHPEKDIHAFDEQHDKKSYHRDILVSTDLLKSVCDFLSPTLFNAIDSQPGIIELPLSNEDLTCLENSLNLYSLSVKDEELSSALKKSVVTHLATLYLKKTQLTNISDQTLVNIIEKMKTPGVLQNGIPALIEETNYSHGHLCRIIRKNFNKSLLDMLTEFRMEKAALLLKTTNTELVDIAYLVGYESLSHFITTFKTKYNLPPYQYRKKYILQSQSQPNFNGKT